ncbi:MAG TPA: hypothetical protein V6D08_02230 [Candidatus Obscuribacterales bacterium]
MAKQLPEDDFEAKYEEDFDREMTDDELKAHYAEAIYVDRELGLAHIKDLWISDKVLDWLMGQGGDIKTTINAYLEVAMEDWEEQEKFLAEERKRKRKEAAKRFRKSVGY